MGRINLLDSPQHPRFLGGGNLGLLQQKLAEVKLRDPPRVVWIVLVELHVNNFIHQILLQLDELLLGECLVSISSEHVVHQTGVGGQQIGLVDVSVAPVASNLVGETSDNVGELLY